jgi:hypothetical protein
LVFASASGCVLPQSPDQIDGEGSGLGVFGVGAKDLLRATRSNQAVEDMDEDLVDSVECLFKARHSAYLYRLELYLQCHHRTADSIWSVGVHFFISSQADPAHAIDIVSHGR